MRQGTIAATLTTAFLMVLGATGCAGLPAVGPVDSVPAADKADPLNRPYTRVIAARPMKGMRPDEIVQGFVAAMADFSNGHAVAREYLVPGNRSAWNPLAREVTVYQNTDETDDRVDAILDEQLAKGATRSSVRVKVNPIGWIGTDGRYSEDGDPPVDAPFELRKVGGEWRIASAPTDIPLLLRSSDISRTYRKVDLHFLTQDMKRVVPDPVFLPITDTDLPVALLRRLVGRWTASLNGAVRTAIPKGTRVLSVRTTGGKTDVRLGGAASQALADQTRRSGLVAQIVYTLGALPGIDETAISIDGTPIGASFRRASMSSFDPARVTSDPTGHLVRDGKLYGLDTRSGKVTPVDGPAGRGEVPLSDPAISYDEKRVAGLTGKGRISVVGLQRNSKPAGWLEGDVLRTPSWDRLGRLWAVSLRKAGTPQVTSQVVWADGENVKDLGLSEKLRNSEITELRVSGDGARVLIISRNSGATTAYVAAITADNEIDHEQPITSSPDREILDATWLDGTHIVLLTRGKGAGGLELTQAEIGSPATERATPLTVPEQVESVATHLGESPILLGAGTKAYYQTPDGFKAVEGGGTDPVYPG